MFFCFMHCYCGCIKSIRQVLIIFFYFNLCCSVDCFCLYMFHLFYHCSIYSIIVPSILSCLPVPFIPRDHRLSGSYGSWMYNYMCNQCHYNCEFESRSWRGVLDITLCWLATSRWFPPPIKLTAALSTTQLTNKQTNSFFLQFVLISYHADFMMGKYGVLFCFVSLSSIVKIYACTPILLTTNVVFL